MGATDLRTEMGLKTTVMGNMSNTRINFDKRYVEPVLKGEKRTTIRKGVRLNLLKKGREKGNAVNLMADREVFARAKINKVVVKRVDELTEDDAVLDGFQSLEELFSALHNIYGEVKDNELVTIIHFDLVD
ncbi:MAG: ASCH domain-containing protein [Archaeoglobaceae archaeon]